MQIVKIGERGVVEELLEKFRKFLRTQSKGQIDIKTGLIQNMENLIKMCVKEGSYLSNDMRKNI